MWFIYITPTGQNLRAEVPGGGGFDPGWTLAVACEVDSNEQTMVRQPESAVRVWCVTVAAALALTLTGAVTFAAEGGGRYEPGTVFRDCAECPEMVVVPADSFRMGDLNGGGDADEGPVRRVEVGRTFAIARFETTFAEWDACVAAGRCALGAGDLGWGRGRRPAINVSPEDAEAFATWLSHLTGAQYRLPSEAEWEYAARAGSETRYPWGNEVGRNRANCDGCGSAWDDAQTAPVGSFPANAFGVHDTVGNVYEWVADCGRYSYEGAPSDGSTWVSEGACRARTMRGGSWVSLPRALRSANRVRTPAGFRDINAGFRVARDLP